MLFPIGATSCSIDVRIYTDNGLPVTGLVAATFPSLTYSRAGANADVAFPALSDLAAITTAWAAGGVKERSGGKYRLDCPNAMFSVAGKVTVTGEATDKRLVVDTIDVGSLEATIVVTPSTTTLSDRVSATTIQAYYAENGWTIGPVVVLDDNDDPVDLTAYTTLRFVVEDQYGTDILNTTSVTVSGVSNNQWSATGTSAVTAVGNVNSYLKWSLRGISTGVNVVLGLGDVRVTHAANADS